MHPRATAANLEPLGQVPLDLRSMYSRGLQIFSVESQIRNILGFGGQKVFVI